MQRFVAFVVLWLLPAAVVAQDMPLSQVLIEGKGWKLAAKDFKAIASLAVDKAGDVYVADPGAGVLRIRPDGTTHPTMAAKQTVSVGIAPSAVVPGHEALLTSSSKNGKTQVEAFTPANDAKGGVSYVVCEDIAMHSFVVARNGTFYCTAPGEQAVYAVAGGKKRKVAEGIARPTGLVLWPDQGTLVVADAAGKHLYAFRIEKDGSLTCKEGYYTLRLPAGQKESGAAGMCMDSAGRLYVASTVGVQCFDPTGRLNGVLLNPTTTPPTAVIFGGADLDQLYLACGDRLFVRETKAQGFVPPAK
jgi:gluconolactonase